MREGVLVLEDDALIRGAVVRQIEASDAFRVVAAAPSVAEGSAVIDAGEATFGLFDLGLVDGSALPLIRKATERGMAVLVLTIWDDDDTVYDALGAGAGGYLLKGDATAKVLDALVTLRDGGAPISPTIARRLLDRFRTPKKPAPPTPTTTPELEDLTHREREIIELFAKGATYDEVAAMLTMSVNTVRHHVRAMYRKLHVCSKAEAVTMAYRIG